MRTGTELARGVVEALERISGMVDETTTAAKEISIATQQQRSASDQVVSAMTQVSDVSRQYAVGSKQAAAAAAQLNVLAAELRSSIAQFKGCFRCWIRALARRGAARACATDSCAPRDRRAGIRSSGPHHAAASSDLHRRLRRNGGLRVLLRRHDRSPDAGRDAGRQR